MRILIEKGADVRVKDKAGSTPLEATRGSWSDVRGISQFLRIPVPADETAFQQRRQQCREILSQNGAGDLKASKASVGSGGSSRSKPAGVSGVPHLRAVRGEGIRKDFRG
jgi:hypothetical protein